MGIFRGIYSSGRDKSQRLLIVQGVLPGIMSYHPHLTGMPCYLVVIWVRFLKHLPLPALLGSQLCYYHSLSWEEPQSQTSLLYCPSYNNLCPIYSFLNFEVLIFIDFYLKSFRNIILYLKFGKTN